MLWRVWIDLKVSAKLILNDISNKNLRPLLKGKCGEPISSVCIICLFIRNTFEMRGTKEQDLLSLHFFIVVKEFAATTAKSYNQNNGKIHIDHYNTNFCIQFPILLKSMRNQCHGQRKSFTVQLNLRPVRRTEWCTIVCTTMIACCSDNINVTALTNLENFMNSRTADLVYHFV